MHPKTRANQDLYLTKEIHNPDRCQIEGCDDDLIGSPDGMSCYCFKHQNYTEI